MKRKAKWLTAALVALVGVSMVPLPAAEAGDVTQTKDNCITAWAILAPNTLQTRSSVKRIIDGNDRLSDEGYEAKVSEKFALMIFDLVDGRGEAIVAHCGHGGTCNFLAREVNRNYPTTSPVVVCTHDPPNSIENGRAF
ncbi:MAG TPA: hypothetical protein ENK57_16010 [Polyangiaceae bacterium]|nr:hypothetical protein [Polyangiaceae bacterium]